MMTLCQGQAMSNDEDAAITQRRRRALYAVTVAVATGVLPSLRSGAVPCKDCGKPATQYDHRDYAKPLEVEPVCGRCNLERGAAKGLVWRERSAYRRREREVLREELWFSIKEFAAAVKLKSWTICKAIRERKIAAVKIAGAVLERFEQRAFVNARMDAIGCPPAPGTLDEPKR